MKKAEEGRGFVGGRNAEPRFCGMRLSNCDGTGLALPRRNISVEGWLGSWSEEIWCPNGDKPKLMLLVLPYKWLPMALKEGGCLALS